ncbi:MAG: accessory gene regulator B family protein [Eubacteriales bacterium]|nr:accessory gene regulator B family protein [Eubacteriales bacterium]MDD4629271.1 accessory gene regulator B family protein [Eubacteriales bacterium]
MKTNVPERITELLLHAGSITSEDKELYEYGVRQGIILIINLVTVIVIGLLIGMVWQSLVFLLAYNPIRSYAGGYHASTQLSCYLLSIPIITIILLGIKIIPWNEYICAVVLLFAGMVLFKLAPVEDLNKSLRQNEIVVYRKKSLIIAAVLTCISILLLLAGLTQISASITMALLMTAVMLILGVFKNNRVKVKEKKVCSRYADTKSGR